MLQGRNKPEELLKAWVNTLKPQKVWIICFGMINPSKRCFAVMHISTSGENQTQKSWQIHPIPTVCSHRKWETCSHWTNNELHFIPHNSSENITPSVQPSKQGRKVGHETGQRSQTQQIDIGMAKEENIEDVEV